MKLIEKNSGPNSKDSIVNRVGDYNIDDRAKFRANSQVKFSKSKNTVRLDFLTKSKSLAKPRFKSGFQTPRAGLTIIELR